MRLLHELLDLSPGLRLNSCAVQANGIDHRYEDLVDSTLRVATGLAQMGVRRNDRVAVCLQNDPAIVETAIACSRLGAILVPINPLLKPRQVHHILTDCEARILISAEQLIASLATLEPATEASYTCVQWNGAAGGVGGYDELKSCPPLQAGRRVIDHDIAAVLYTSGTTGHPKGVMLSHRNLVEGAACVTRYLDNVAEDRILAALPLSFDYGLSQVTTALRVGACAILAHYTLPNLLVRQVAEQRVSGLAGVPTMWAHLAHVTWPEECQASLRYITNSGGALLPPIVASLRKVLPRTRIFAMYGLTEAFRSTYLEPSEIDARPSSVGKALPNQEILVMRPDGTACGPNEPGELGVHRGSLVAMGYWNDPVLTEARFRRIPKRAGGTGHELAVWSGDIVKADEEGFLYFLGRSDDQIKTSGYRVSPTEIEEVVTEVPGVLTAVAFAIPDEMIGHRVGVAIRVSDATMPTDLVSRVRRHCRNELPIYMVPSEIHVIAALPLTPNGKPDRRAVATELLRDRGGT